MAAPLVPPFTRDTAIAKVRMAEDGWNSRDPQRVSLVYTEDSRWRNRAEFPVGRKQIVEFLTRKWARELDYRLIKRLDQRPSDQGIGPQIPLAARASPRRSSRPVRSRLVTSSHCRIDLEPSVFPPEQE